MATAQNTAPTGAPPPTPRGTLRTDASELPALIAGSVPVGRLAKALAEAGLGAHYDGDRRALVIEPANAREPARNAADARIGIAWWNGLTPTRRRYWLDVAGSAAPADAWRAFQMGESAP